VAHEKKLSHSTPAAREKKNKPQQVILSAHEKKLRHSRASEREKN